MLAMANQRGEVMGSIPGLANRARVTIAEAEDALRKFMSPDAYSRTKDHEGRRIEEIDGGWRLLTYEKHREQCHDDGRRAYKREWIRNRRNVDKSRQSTVSTSVHVDTEVEAEADIDKTLKSKSVSHFVRPTIFEIREYCQHRNNGIDPEKFFAYYESQGWYVGKKRMRNWKYAVITWEKNNYGGEFNDGNTQAAGRGGSQPNKAELRTIRNQEAIIAGLGFSKESRRGGPSEQDGTNAGGNSGLAKNLLIGETGSH